MATFPHKSEMGTRAHMVDRETEGKEEDEDGACERREEKNTSYAIISQAKLPQWGGLEVKVGGLSFEFPCL